MASKECTIFYFFFLLCFTSQAFDNQTDLLSLLFFKDKISDDPLQIMTSWNNSISFCLWKGVTCSSKHARVTMLILQSQKLGGSLSPALANLTFLQVLDLRGNFFRGHIPAEIGRLYRLRYLYLMDNKFEGEIPVNISYCTQLQVINLNYNSLTGKIPKELTSLSELIAFHVSANKLTGGIPPVLGNLSSLVNLSIAQNPLGGTIPDELGKLVNLEFLQVGSNNLSGEVPQSLYNLSRISIFAITNNKLVGSLFSSIGTSFSNLKQLLVGINGFSGLIPASLSNISGLQMIDLPDNQFSGKVPSDFGRITDLKRLNVGRNRLGDGLEFIDSLTNCSKLEVLGIDSNEFFGPLPRTIANLSMKMNTLQLGQNSLSGTIPSGITNLINLNTLNIRWNLFDGPVLPDIGKLFNLKQLYLNSNRLSGMIPSGIGNLTSLFELRLDGNELGGRIPSSLGNCQQLQLLNLSENRLVGETPVQVFALTSLTVSLNLAHKFLNGTLHMYLGNFVNLKELDVSYNAFSGRVPDSLGRCLSLEHVYMQGNSLTGLIPSTLSALKGLQNLDLSRNKFSGKIPQFLQDFVFLQYLNLSYNHFEGEVPKKGVFANKSAISLTGNTNLCGGNMDLQLPACYDSARRGKPNHIKLVIAIVSGVLASFALLYATIFNIRRRSTSNKSAITTSPSEDHCASNFSYKELEKATNGFSLENLVGIGSFSSVYKGSFFGKSIAVKVLIKLQEKSLSKIYMTECEALSKIRHRNLVKVLGWCSSVDSEGRDFKAIVLDFLPKGSLERWLHPNDETKEVHNLDVVQRLSIAIDVGCALEYLHCFSEVAVAHCDLKPGNVLLDDDLCAHLSDFGLAKFVTQVQSSSIGIRGSIGYVAPEYGMGGPASVYGDVYSFGILILEMFTGKRPTDDLFKDGLSLHNYAKAALSNNLIIDIIDPSLVLHLKKEAEATTFKLREKLKQCLVLAIRIGVACSQEVPQERMNIKDANRNLQLIRDLFLEN